MAYDNLTTVASLKAWLKITGPSNDAELATLISVASDLIGRYCGRSNLGSIGTYTENYFRRGGLNNQPMFDLVLRHYPVTSLTSVVMGGSPVTILDQTGLQSQNAGVFLLEDEEPRILKFRSLRVYSPITVMYQAGYSVNAVPPSISQAANQFAGEILRSASWIGKKSEAMAGETTTYDPGESWGLSKRAQALLQPYRNVNPFMGAGG